MNKRLYFLASMIVFGFGALAQSVDQSVIASGGDYVQNGNTALSYTIGQTVTATLSNGGTLTQGFQQNSYTIVEIPEQSSQEFSVSVYPVPASGSVTVEFNSDFQGNAKISLVDELGRTLSEKDATTSVNTISLQGLSASYYFLRINYQGKVKTFKVQKINK